MGNKSNNPVTIESYRSRGGRVKSIYTPDIIYQKKLFGIIVVLACVAIDLCCLFATWDGVQMADPIVTLSIALACAVALDVPLAVAAEALKKYHHRMLNFNEMMFTVIPAVAIFMIAFFFSFGMRMVTGANSFGDSAAVTLIDSSGAAVAATDSESDSLIVRWASLFSGIVPLLTSIASYVVSYFSAAPLNNRLQVLEDEKVGLDNNIIELDVAVSQAEDSVTHCERLLAREEDLYKAFLSKLDAEERALKERYRNILKEKIGTAEAITVITESSEELDKPVPVVEETPKSLEFIREIIRDNPKPEEENTSGADTTYSIPIYEEPIFTEKPTSSANTADSDIEPLDNTDEDNFAA